MIIGLGWDETYTLDPGFYDFIIDAAIVKGHEIVIVSERRPTVSNAEEVKHPKAKVYFTDSQPKKRYMSEQGIKVDVWWESRPEVL